MELLSCQTFVLNILEFFGAESLQNHQWEVTNSSSKLVGTGVSNKTNVLNYSCHFIL